VVILISVRFSWSEGASRGGLVAMKTRIEVEDGADGREDYLLSVSIATSDRNALRGCLVRWVGRVAHTRGKRHGRR